MRLLFSFLFVLLMCHTAAAQQNSSRIFRFLEMSPGARASAMGGNHVALYSADFSHFYVNPAVADSASTGTISASFLNFLGDANLGAASSSIPLKSGILAFGIRFLGYGEMHEYDENGNELGNFHPADIALSAAYSTKLSDNVKAGLAASFIHASYAAYQSSAAAISGGLYYQDSENGVSAGVSVRNLGAQITTFAGQREPLPLDISAGISKKPEKFPFHLHLTLRQLNNWDMRLPGEASNPNLLNNLFRHVIFGAEARFTENFFLRLGYDHLLHEQTATSATFDFAGIAYGVGFAIKNIQFDVSRNSYSKLGGITQLSIKTKAF